MTGRWSRLRSTIKARIQERFDRQLREETHGISWLGAILLGLLLLITLAPWFILIGLSDGVTGGMLSSSHFISAGGLFLLAATSAFWSPSWILRQHQRRIRRRSVIHGERLAAVDVLFAQSRVKPPDYERIRDAIRRFLLGRAPGDALKVASSWLATIATTAAIAAIVGTAWLVLEDAGAYAGEDTPPPIVNSWVWIATAVAWGMAAVTTTLVAGLRAESTKLLRRFEKEMEEDYARLLQHARS